MEYRHIFGALLLGAFLGRAGLAQQPDSQAQNDTAQQADQHAVPISPISGGLLSPPGEVPENSSPWINRGPMIPSIIGGYVPSLAFSTEMARSNYIRGGVSVQNAFDDNALLSSAAGGTNYTLSIFPQIALDQTRRRIHWVLDYAGGYTFNTNLKPQNLTSQDLNFDVQYRLSPHANMRVSESAYYTSGLFAPLSNYNGTTPGVPQETNPFVATPISSQFGNISRGDIGYQLSGSSAVGASGGYMVHRFSNLAPETNLLNTEGEDAAGFYMHRLFAGNWLGLSYGFQHLIFPPSFSETFIHSAFVFDTITLREHMSLSFFGGPQYSDNTAPVSFGSSLLTVQKGWSAAGGASYSWQGSNTSVSIDLARRLSDGGGLLGTAEVNSASGALRRRITREWAAELSAVYAVNNALNPAVSDRSSIRYATGEFDVERQFSERLLLRFGYGHQFQSTTSAALIRNDANRNQFLFTVAYQFTRPWGR